MVIKAEMLLFYDSCFSLCIAYEISFALAPNCRLNANYSG